MGWAYLPNGDVYQGQYRRGQRHGKGLYVFTNGARYLGEYRCGLKRGTGKFYYPDGSTYDGQWKKDIKHGQGLYAYPNGDTYDGSWYKGLRHGVGTYTFADAKCAFHGTWKEGVRIGPAELIFRRHRFYGTWDDQDPVGPGAYTFACKTMALGYVRMEPQDGAWSAEQKITNQPEEDRVAEPRWMVQRLDNYEYSQLPLEPMPLPLADSEDEECPLTPTISEEDMNVYEVRPCEEEEAEEEMFGEMEEEETIEK